MRSKNLSANVAMRIATLINEIECAYLRRLGAEELSAGWYSACADIYRATGKLVELGIPMAILGASEDCKDAASLIAYSEQLAARGAAKQVAA